MDSRNFLRVWFFCISLTCAILLLSLPGSARALIIDIWYGEEQPAGENLQVFGQPGVPQRWVNILGNVSGPEEVASLTYSLNGGPELPLSVGPDQRRLDRTGDFNVEIDYADLLDGTPNQLIITAIDGDIVDIVLLPSAE